MKFKTMTREDVRNSALNRLLVKNNAVDLLDSSTGIVFENLSNTDARKIVRFYLLYQLHGLCLAHRITKTGDAYISILSCDYI